MIAQLIRGRGELRSLVLLIHTLALPTTARQLPLIHAKSDHVCQAPVVGAGSEPADTGPGLRELT